jgi:prepilin-type processing-associated H-X9-DG protein
MSYASNRDLCQATGINCSIPAIKKPAQVIMVLDWSNVDTPSMVNSGSFTATMGYENNANPNLVRMYKALHRHLEGTNWAFADGHVKWYKPEAALGATAQVWFDPTKD